MIGVYFEDSKKSKRKTVGKYKTQGEASTAVVKYAGKHRIPMDSFRHIKENGYDIYDLGIWGRFLIITE